MTDVSSHPPWWRILLAFAVVPLIASAGMASMQPGFAGLPLLERIARTTIVYAFLGPIQQFSSWVFQPISFCDLGSNLRC
jgi:hypothetical protein